MATFNLFSDAFLAGDIIPIRHTCEGKDISPPLTWGDPPEGTQSFALICDDPDAPAGDWVHWLLYDIPPNVRGLPQGIEKDPELPDGSRQGRNGFGRLGYAGPCPPSGRGAHRYFFTLYALDTRLGLAPAATKQDLLAAMEGHVLAKAELMGRFERATKK
jgi:Raf kinase inhibitor-like YbhB/YbcL family protein